MSEYVNSVTNIVLAIHPEWTQEYGDNYIKDQIAAAISNPEKTPPRGTGAEETDISMIVQTVLGITTIILNIVKLVEKIKPREDRIAAIRREVADWNEDRKEALVKAVLEEVE